MDMNTVNKKDISFTEFQQSVKDDYRLAWVSRNLSIMARKEVLTGKAKFGIFGDGKEVAQIALAKTFRKGDWRSGYYRDQTLVMAIGAFSPEEFFAQLYGQTDIKLSPSHGGRSFNNHFASRSLNQDGTWKNLMEQANTSADISPTAGQMPRLLGLAYASKLFRQNKELHRLTTLTDKGNEVAFGTIGDSSTAEGHFFEMMNAAGVLQVPVAVAVWDDGYGISVPKEYQMIKQDISEVLAGFKKRKDTNGILIYQAKGWDYPGLCRIFEEGVARCREEHVPVLFHITEMNQPLGHSTSGSHERYKSKERLEWEAEFDPIKKMGEWMIEKQIATREELDHLEKHTLEEVKKAKNEAWKKYQGPINKERDEVLQIVRKRSCTCSANKTDQVDQVAKDLSKVLNPIRKDIFSAAKKIIRHVCLDCNNRDGLQDDLRKWLKENYEKNHERYSAYLYNETSRSAIKVKGVKPEITENSPEVPGREILRDNFDYLFEHNPLLVTFGEDTGKIGDVNQGLEGLQKKYGELRITDTGIRETTIIGQGIGMALRGLRPIAEIQYFDYILYALQTLSDDLATTHYRTKAGQIAPVIIRTRGHRLEGIWHSGSPLGMVINSIRGIYVCVPRDMTQAAGFYNTLLEAEDAALVIEPLNGYRLKEKRPENIGQFKTPLGIPEVLKEGADVTLVTYGSCVRIAQEAVNQLQEFGIDVELIDVQTLLPFDINHMILSSLKKTQKIVFFDEDVPGGATAFMMQKVLEEQKGFYDLDAEPRTITAKDHRPAYATDGDYFSNPNAEDVFETIYDLMHHYDPQKYPALY